MTTEPTEAEVEACPHCGGTVRQRNVNYFYCEGTCLAVTIFMHCSTSNHARRLWSLRAAAEVRAKAMLERKEYQNEQLHP